jgi:hypothetical protein
VQYGAQLYRPFVVGLENMKYRASRIGFTFLALAFAGCSSPSPDAARPATTVAYQRHHDFGIVEVSDGIPSRLDLGGGRVCLITPAILKDGSIFLSMSVEKSGKMLAAPTAHTGPDSPVWYSRGDISFEFTPHIKQ